MGSTFFTLLVLGIIVTGIVRWGYKFADQIRAGGMLWLQPAFTLLAAVVIGVAYAIATSEDATLSVPFMGLVYAAGTLALIQFGYELIVKPLLALAALVIAAFIYLTNRLAPPVAPAPVTDSRVTAPTAESAAVTVDKAALAKAQATLDAAKAALKNAQAVYAAAQTAENATAVATAQAAVDSAQATVDKAASQVTADTKASS
jgi:hypothetical protein